MRPMGRIAGGVRAIKLEDDDEVVSMELVQPDEELAGGDEQTDYGKRTAGQGLQGPGKRRQGAADLRQEQVQEDRKTDRRHGR